MKRSRIIFTVGLCALLSCASFLRKVDAARIKHHEKRDYVLTQDVTQGEMTLKKGERVKLYIITGDDNIKVYCYSAQSEFLKANRVLILYLFEDDFNGNRFDVKTFNSFRQQSLFFFFFYTYIWFSYVYAHEKPVLEGLHVEPVAVKIVFEGIH